MSFPSGERSSAAHAVVQAARACRQGEQCHFSRTCSEFSRQITNYFASFLILIRLQKIYQNALVSKNEGPGKHPNFANILTYFLSEAKKVCEDMRYLVGHFLNDSLSNT